VFEDDMEVSPHYYEGLSVVHSQRLLSDSRVTAFCLHPNDREVNINPRCSDLDHSSIFYETPEPCNLRQTPSEFLAVFDKNSRFAKKKTSCALLRHRVFSIHFTFSPDFATCAFKCTPDSGEKGMQGLFGVQLLQKRGRSRKVTKFQ
jgi:hypothetical protein